MKQIILDNLKKFGLSESEARVYCAALSLEEGTVDKIAKQADLNRTSTYPILERLKGMGLLGQGKKKKKTVFKAVQPHKFFELLEERKNSIQEILPDLRSLFAVSRGRPDVAFFEGEEGLKTVMNMALDEAKEIFILGEGESFLAALPLWSEAYVEKRVKKNIRVKIILKATPFAVKSVKKLQASQNQASQLFKVRLLPESYKISRGGIDLYGNKIVMYSYEKNYHAVVVESAVISQIMRTTFDILWETAGNYEKLLK